MKANAQIENLQKVTELGEGQFIEFKESLDKNFPKELVAFANASGGKIYIGITDTGKINGFNITNKVKSEIQDIARNCDPPVLLLLSQTNNVLIIEVKEGINPIHVPLAST